jgi:hypothetical protein
MFAHTRFCTMAIALAAWLLLSPKSTPAQVPPGETTDQRLRRLEEKIDKLLASHPEPKVSDAKSQPKPDGSGLALLNQAAERLKQALEAAQKDYYAHAVKTGAAAPLRGPPSLAVLLERLAKVESRRQQLQAEVSEAQQNHALVEHVYRKEGKGAALQVLAAKGVRISGVDATAALDKQFMELMVARRRLAVDVGAAHPQVRSLDEQIDLLKKLFAPTSPFGLNDAGPPKPGDGKLNESDFIPVILAAMKDEIASKKQRIQALNREFDVQLKDAFDVGKQDAELLRLKARLDDTKMEFETVLRAIGEVQSRRSPK